MSTITVQELGALKAKSGALKSEKYQIPSIVRAFRIMEELSHTPAGMTITEISRALHLPVSSTSAILNTLHSIGYLTKENSSYILGTRVLEIGNRVLEEMDIKPALESALRRLVDRVTITAHAGILEDTSVVFIDKIEAKSFIKINTYVGRRSHVHCTALGKVLLAYQDQAEQKKIVEKLALPRFTPNTITTRGDLLEALKEVREKGYAIDDEEEELGIRCIGAPVFDKTGRIIAAISLAGTTAQLSVSKLSSLTEALRETARSISRKVGYHE